MVRRPAVKARRLEFKFPALIKSQVWSRMTITSALRSSDKTIPGPCWLVSLV